MIARLGPSRIIVADDHPLFRAALGRVELGGLVQHHPGRVASRPLAVLSKHLLGETGWLKALQQALFLTPALDYGA